MEGTFSAHPHFAFTFCSYFLSHGHVLYLVSLRRSIFTLIIPDRYTILKKEMYYFCQPIVPLWISIFIQDKWHKPISKWIDFLLTGVSVVIHTPSHRKPFLKTLCMVISLNFRSNWFKMLNMVIYSSCILDNLQSICLAGQVFPPLII